MRFFIYLLVLFCCSTHANSNRIMDVVEFKLDNYQLPAIENDVLYLAINAYFEDRQHDLRGMYLINLVVLNRLNDGRNRWPEDIESIIMQPSNDPDRPLACKFSWVCDYVPDIIDDSESFDLAIKAAQQALAEWEYDQTFGATFYYKCKLHGRDSWMRKLVQTTKHGVHCFYKSR